MRIPVFCVCAATVLMISGCTRPVPSIEPAPDPIVIVGSPSYEEVVDYEEFTGRAEASLSITLRSRVTGYLEEVHFEDGAKVSKGDLLFSTDPRLFQAEVDRTQANIRLAEARLERLERDFQRAERLRSSSAISAEEYDRFVADYAEGQAALKVAQAANRTAEQNLDYTKIYAPASGIMSRRFADPGNLINADITPLSLLVVSNPIFINFDVDDRTYLAIRRATMNEAMNFDFNQETTIDVGLPDESDYSMKAKVNFIDNTIDAGTGTIRLRATLENPDNLVTPGLFVRVRLPIGPPTRQLLVPESAIATDQGLRVIYAVNDANEVVRRRVKQVGKTYRGMRVLLDTEVQSADRIIIEGQQRARAGSKVRPQMPKALSEGKPNTAPKDGSGSAS